MIKERNGCVLYYNHMCVKNVKSPSSLYVGKEMYV